MVLNKSVRPNERPNTAPMAVESLAEFEKKCNLSDHSDTTLKPKYRLLQVLCLSRCFLPNPSADCCEILETNTCLLC